MSSTAAFLHPLFFFLLGFVWRWGCSALTRNACKSRNSRLTMRRNTICSRAEQSVVIYSPKPQTSFVRRSGQKCRDSRILIRNKSVFLCVSSATTTQWLGKFMVMMHWQRWDVWINDLQPASEDRLKKLNKKIKNLTRSQEKEWQLHPASSPRQFHLEGRIVVCCVLTPTEHLPLSGRWRWWENRPVCKSNINTDSDCCQWTPERWSVRCLWEFWRLEFVFIKQTHWKILKQYCPF